ncbi:MULTISPECIES: L-lactate permease [unclassified Luteococcus]|uniref:L-lactate permease n=1 Tax=unclassified Luteococcus TaxID=2639923 RepID=UPI00313AAB54
MNPFRPELYPLGSVWLSVLVAILPLLVIFVGLGILKWKAHVAGLAAVATALATAALGFKMPISLAALSATEGFVFGLFPIVWIVLMAIWFYQITVVSGRFEDLRATFNLISDDPRVTALLVAFCFGGLLEALAGFGAPVAITGVMLLAVGFPKLKAALSVMVANTAPVAFGAVAIPIITAGKVSGIPYEQIGAIAGRQTAVLALVVPFVLLWIVDGIRGLKQVWPAALAIGGAFAVAKWITSNYISVELTDVIASLVGMAAGVVLMRFWQPKGTAEAQQRLADESAAEGGNIVLDRSVDNHIPGSRIAMALLPYILVVAVFSVANLVGPLKRALASTDVVINWPGLHGHVLNGAGKVHSSTVYTFQWLSGAGTLLLFVGILTAIIYRVSFSAALKEFTDTAYKLRFTVLTIGSVVALAYVMNLSGQTTTIGTWIAGTGSAFAFLSPVLGWIGVAVTGSDTSANALFCGLQATVGHETGLNPTLLATANTTGGVAGKLVSPQNIAIVATAVGLVGKESVILRKTIGYSLGLLALICLMVGLQSTPVLSWMLP